MSKTEIPKVYEPQTVEDSIYQMWEESGFFNPDNLPAGKTDLLKGHKQSFTISMPPPNVTGILHLGHAFENSLMDIQIRYQRMNGKKALLVPGTDHAAVATQARVEDRLKKQGIKNPRQELGREKLLEEIKVYAENSKQTIIKQIKKMGTSCDWSRLAYTFDEPRSAAVNQLFKMMYDDGLIYRGYRVVNWSVKGQSTCSDDELVYREQQTKIYTFKYSKDFPIPIATTRPETKLGDTAVAVNPKDKRYQQYIGQEFTVEVGAKNPLKIKVIADENIDSAYGTGAVGVTPAHSAIDFEMYQKNKEIGLIQVIGADGKMTQAAGTDYQGLTTLEAREKFVTFLQTKNLLIKEEEITNSVGTSDRFEDVVEALPMEQWFIDVNKIIPKRNKSLKDLMREAVVKGHGGDKAKKIKILPERFETVYLHWIDSLRDWNISRQIWWGHRIPVWYKNDEVYVDIIPPQGEGWSQDEDTLDTWFSSGAWTFSTLGWPDQTSDLKTFHPTTWMQMGYEILFFWMARMILMSTYALNEIPFKDVYIHGILRDEKGQKFSKSLGNGIDPIELINKYGTDALRLSLIKGVTPGNDARFYEEKVEASRNFVNKFWNISRFILQSVDQVTVIQKKPKTKTLADQWILAKLDLVSKEVTRQIDEANFSLAAETLYEFTWSDFADWYLESAKVEKNKDDILLYVLQSLLKLWHPFIPFVTETVWGMIVEDKNQLLMVQTWPKISKKIDNEVISDFELIKNIIVAIRNLRSESKIPPAQKLNAVIISARSAVLINKQEILIKELSRLNQLEVLAKGNKPEQVLSATLTNVEIYLPVSGMIDVVKEIKRLTDEAINLAKFIKSLEQKLNNKQFVNRAPKEIVETEKAKLTDAKTKFESINQQLKTLK